MSKQDLSWSIPVMRAGYAGRGVVYLAVAGYSLYSIWLGGQAEGASSAMQRLQSTAGGSIVLLIILVGMFAFALWRAVDAAYDLDDRGSDAKGIAVRLGLIGSAVVHVGLGLVAFTLLFLGGGGSGGSSSAQWLSTAMSVPGGRVLVGVIGAAVVVTGAYQIYKGWTEKYRKHLAANRFTQRWSWILTAGLIAKGIVLTIVGGLFVFAAWRFDPNAAGGTEEALSWLTGQPYGRALVAAICVGLLGFAVFCFVSAVYRIVPKVDDDATESLLQWVEARVR